MPRPHAELALARPDRRALTGTAFPRQERIVTASSTFNASSGDGYEQIMGRWSRRLAVPFLAFAGVARGERVLDVGCGTGSLTFLLAERPELEAICGIDYAAPYIEHATRRNADPRVSFRVGDACARLPGVGGAKLARYAQTFLAVIAEYVEKELMAPESA
jgi:SAM-dependent methyltransferase